MPTSNNLKVFFSAPALSHMHLCVRKLTFCTCVIYTFVVNVIFVYFSSYTREGVVGCVEQCLIRGNCCQLLLRGILFNVIILNADWTLPLYENVFYELHDSAYELPESTFNRCTLTIFNIFRVFGVAFGRTREEITHIAPKTESMIISMMSEENIRFCSIDCMICSDWTRETVECLQECFCYCSVSVPVGKNLKIVCHLISEKKKQLELGTIRSVEINGVRIWLKLLDY